MKKLLFSYGTRPEAIKLAPIVGEFEALGLREQIVLVHTGQHVDTLRDFDAHVQPDYCLHVLAANQPMRQLRTRIATRLTQLLDRLRSSGTQVAGVVVQGDTLSTLVSAEAAHKASIPVFHVEAGLRTHRFDSPFPEEYIRHRVARLAAVHFAPSQWEREHLLAEGIADTRIHVVGNTINDALLTKMATLVSAADNRDTVLFSMHRYENLGVRMARMVTALLRLAHAYPSLRFVWPAHPRKSIQELISQCLANQQIEVLPALSYDEMLAIYARSVAVITDSGGVMEESAALGIPRIVVRECHERKSLTQLPSTVVHNPDTDNLQHAFERILAMKHLPSKVYGNGTTARQIVALMRQYLRAFAAEQDWPKRA